MSKKVSYPFTQVFAGHYRPYIPIRIINPHTNDSIGIMALLDTGADDCVFPKAIADVTKHNLKGDGVISHVTQGVGEIEITVWKHTFIVELINPERTEVLWKSAPTLMNCLEHDKAPPLLGFASFLSNFIITFDYPAKAIIIEIP